MDHKKPFYWYTLQNELHYEKGRETWKLCQKKVSFLCTILFEVTWASAKMWTILILTQLSCGKTFKDIGEGSGNWQAKCHSGTRYRKEVDGIIFSIDRGGKRQWGGLGRGRRRRLSQAESWWKKTREYKSHSSLSNSVCVRTPPRPALHPYPSTE